MANEFIIRKGYKSLSSSEITGSLNVSADTYTTDVFIDGHGSVSASLSSIVANDLDGSGTANYISKFSDTDTLTDSSISDDGSTVNIFANSTGNTGVVSIYGEGGVPPTLLVSSRTNRAKLKIADNDTAINIIAEGDIGSFGFGSTSSATNNISILSTGRVGIGVIASTNAMLDVRGPDTDNAVLGRFWSNTGGRGSFIIRNGTNVSPTTFIGTAGGSEQLSIGTNNTEAIRILASNSPGNSRVGIGTSSPLHPLHVVGNISGSDTYINGWNSVSGSLSTITTTHTNFSASVSTRFEGLTTDYTELDNIPDNIISSSAQVDHDQTTNFVAGEHFLQSAITTVGTVTTGNVNAILPTNTVSSSAQIASDISGSITSFSGSIAGRVETNESSIASLNGATGSYLLNTTDTLTGNLTVTGTLTAQEFHTEFVSASILFDSGSTKFGDSSDDKHSFTGSLEVSGSGITIKVPTTPKIELIDQTNDLSLKFRAANNYGYIDLDSGNTVGSSRLLLRTDGYPFLYGNQNHDVYIPSGSLTIGTESTTGNFNSYISATRQLTHNGNGGDLSIISDNNSAPVFFVKGTGTADLVNIYDNTTEVFTILDGGNVGIGITSPTNKLDIEGVFGVKRVGVAATSTIDMGGNFNFDAFSGYSHVFKQSGIERVRILPNGNLGIGTTNPVYKLHIAGNVNIAGTGGYLRWNSGDVAIKNEGSYKLGFQTYNATSSTLTTKMVLDTDGNVGIGTTSPSAKLEVNGVIRSRGGTYIADIDTKTNVGLVIPENDFIYTADGSSYLRKLIGKTGDVITIGEAGTSLIDGINLLPGGNGGYVQIYNNSSIAAKFVDGKLGIGTTSPTINFEVVGNGTGNSGIGFKQSGAQEHRLFATSQVQNNAIGSSAPIWKWGQSDATGSISSQKMLLNNSGLTVTGDIDSDDITIDGWGSVSGSLASIATAGGVNGSGTTNDVVMWSGANSLADAPIAISGNNATFAGAVSTGGYLTLNSSDSIPRLIFNGSGDDFFFSNTANYFGLYNDTDSRWDIKVDGAGDTTFAGDVTVDSTHFTLKDSSPEFYFHTEGNHYNWLLAAQENVDGGFEIGHSSATATTLDQDASNYTRALTLHPTTGATFAGDVSIAEKLIHSGDTNTYLQFPGTNDKIVFATNGSDALTLDAVNTATFAGNIGANKNVYQDISSKGGFVMRPWGADYLNTTTNVHTGAIKITLPTGANQEDDMIKFTIDVYQYVTNESFSIDVGGYIYKAAGQADSWRSVTAIVNTKSASENYTVRFGDDGTNHCIWVGELNTTWNHPNIICRNFYGGFAVETEDYLNEWDVSFEATSFSHVSQTQSNNLPLTNGGINGAFLPLSAGGTKPLVGDLYINSSLYFGGANERIYMNGGGATNWRGVEVNSTGMWSWGETGTKNYFAKKVGIGTSDPANMLHVHSTGNGAAALILEDDARRLELGRDQIVAKLADGSAVANLYIQPSGNTSLASNSGNVGIGTTSPGTKLQVDAGSNIASFRSVGSGQNDKELLVHSGGDRVVLDSRNASDSSATSLALELGTSEKVRLTTTGLGIGTSIPGYPLSLENGGTGLISRIYNTNADGQGLLIRAGATTSTTRALQVASSNDTKIMTVNSNGRVGIGTTNPGTKLYVDAGQSTFNRGNSAGTIATFRGQNSAKAVIATAQSYFLSNVGIGTTANTKIDLTGIDPRLHVLGDSTTGAYNLVASFQAGNDANDTGAAIRIHHSNDRGLLIKAGRADSDREVAYLDLVSSGGTETNMLTLRKVGNIHNVGIGTTSPSKKFNIVGHSGTGVIQSVRNPSTSWGQYALTRYGTEADDFRYMDFGYYRGTDAEAQRGLVIQSQANANLVTFLDNGNVGIGTTVPENKLDVRGTGTVARFVSSNGYVDHIMVNSGATNFLNFSGSTFNLYNNGGSAGNITLSITPTTATFTGNVTVEGALTETSARRFKENIKTLDSQISNISKLNPVSFDWKKDSKTDIGFIAEEVKEVYPNLVSEENGEIKGVQYTKLTAILVKALQDQQKQIDELKEEIFILKKK